MAGSRLCGLPRTRRMPGDVLAPQRRRQGIMIHAVAGPAVLRWLRSASPRATVAALPLAMVALLHAAARLAAELVPAIAPALQATVATGSGAAGQAAVAAPPLVAGMGSGVAALALRSPWLVRAAGGLAVGMLVAVVLCHRRRLQRRVSCLGQVSGGQQAGGQHQGGGFHPLEHEVLLLRDRGTRDLLIPFLPA